MLDITDRRNCFYWQTDRNLTAEDYEKYFLRRQQVKPEILLQILSKGITSVKGEKHVSVLEPDKSVVKGNVNIVRKVEINGTLYVARMHPFGIKNGYFYVERCALNAARSAGVPVPQVVDIHEAKSAEDMDFMLMTASNGVTMDNAIEAEKGLENKLLVDAGKIFAKIHGIRVEGFGSFDNGIAKKENRLVGLHKTYHDFIWCGLEENLQRLISFKVIDKQRSDDFTRIFKENNFEPVDGPRLIHNDYADWNMLVDSGKISAIIDWDECHAGDPVADLACWSTFFDMERYGHMLKGYKTSAKLPDDYELRFHYYRLRYTISKMALRVKRAQVDSSDFLAGKIKTGKVALQEEIDWFDEYKK